MIRLLLVLLLLAWASRVDAATYYVNNTGGDDARSCGTAQTQGTPRLTISAGVACAVAGDVVSISAGTYTGGLNVIDTASFTVNSGTSFSNAITIRPDSGEVVTIQPPNGVAGVRLVNGGRSYLIFQDLIFDGVNFSGEASVQLIYLSDGSHHNRFERVEVKNSSNYGVVFSRNNGNSPFNEFIDGSVHDNGSGVSGTNGHGFYISTSDNLIEGNTIYSNLGYGLHFYDDAGPLNTARNIIRNNRLYDNGRPGVTTAFAIIIAWGADNQVYNNVIYGNTGCIQVSASGSDVVLYHNTCYNNSDYGIELTYITDAPTLTNNIVFQNGSGISQNGPGPAVPVLTTNLLSNPSFVDAGAANFALLTGSAAINTGVTVAAVTSDIIGTTRPQGAVYDIGAYEFNVGDLPPPEVVKAFPSAEGYGATSVGGRGGTAIAVTNLNNAGAGSLRACITTAGPRTCVFRVSGNIDALTPLIVTEPYLTIAGQTAPGGGVQIRGHGLWIQDHNVIVRHLRVRPGDVVVGRSPAATETNAIIVYGNHPDVYRVILDHCDAMYGNDQNADVWAAAYDVTYQWCVVGPPSNLGHSDGGPHPLNALNGSGYWTGDNPTKVQNITLHHNVYASAGGRNPLMGTYPGTNSPALRVDLRNNVVYNWAGNNFTEIANAFFTLAEWQSYNAAGSTGSQINLIGNRYKRGPASSGESSSIAFMDHFTKVWAFDNWGPDAGSPQDGFAVGIDFWNTGPQDGGLDGQYYYYGQYTPTSLPVSGWNAVATAEHSVPAVATTAATSVMSVVLAGAGARVPAIDSLTQSVLDSVSAGTGPGLPGGTSTFLYPTLAAGTPPSDVDADGMPDSWETPRGLNPNSGADGAVTSTNGYTHLENYLNALAGDIIPGDPYGTPPPPQPPAVPPTIPRLRIGLP